jgi:hypothetical protein
VLFQRRGSSRRDCMTVAVRRGVSTQLIAIQCNSMQFRTIQCT